MLVAGLIHTLKVKLLLGDGSDCRNVFTLYVELAELAQIINHKVVDPDSFLGLLESVLVTMDLGKDCAKLHLQARNYPKISHAVADFFFFQVYA